MVDANGVDLARLEQFQNEAMRGFEDARILHAQRGEIVDVEEAPIVDVV